MARENEYISSRHSALVHMFIQTPDGALTLQYHLIHPYYWTFSYRNIRNGQPAWSSYNSILSKSGPKIQFNSYYIKTLKTETYDGIRKDSPYRSSSHPYLCYRHVTDEVCNMLHRQAQDKFIPKKSRKADRIQAAPKKKATPLSASPVCVERFGSVLVNLSACGAGTCFQE